MVTAPGPVAGRWCFRTANPNKRQPQHPHPLPRPPRGRTAVVRGFDEAPAPSWATVQTVTPRWKGYRKQREVFAANRAWDQRHGNADPEVYRQEILPRLDKVSIRELQAITGLSKTTCSQIRRGRRVPHARHWEGLREAARAAV